MKLQSLLEELTYELKQGSVDTEITTLVYDSRKVEEGSVFVCISGTVRDAHVMIKDGRTLSGHETMPFFIGKGMIV